MKCIWDLPSLLNQLTRELFLYQDTPELLMYEEKNWWLNDVSADTLYVRWQRTTFSRKCSLVHIPHLHYLRWIHITVRIVGCWIDSAHHKGLQQRLIHQNRLISPPFAQEHVPPLVPGIPDIFFGFCLILAITNSDVPHLMMAAFLEIIKPHLLHLLQNSVNKKHIYAFVRSSHHNHTLTISRLEGAPKTLQISWPSDRDCCNSSRLGWKGLSVRFLMALFR